MGGSFLACLLKSARARVVYGPIDQQAVKFSRDLWGSG